MGGCRCSYKNCTNSTKSSENTHFFHYPVRHKERCKIWIENANKPHFVDYEEEQLRNKVICEVHFEDKYFPNMQKKRLLQGAIPTLDGDSGENVGIKNKMLVQEIQVLPANDDGTIFILETQEQQPKVKTPEVESYVYKNGLILPSTSKSVPIETFSLSILEDSKSKVRLLAPQKKAIGMEAVEKTRVLLPRGKNEVLVKIEEQTVPDAEIITMKDEYMEVVAEDSMPKKKAIPVRPVSKTYLKKINQHSREIATIKKMLRQKSLMEVDEPMILKKLKDKLPPTLYAVLQLHLTPATSVVEEDLAFFKAIYDKSANTYDLLRKEYSWNLPEIQSDNAEIA